MDNTVKKSYYFNVIESKDGQMAEVMNFNFGGHHDLAALVEKAKSANVVSEDKYAKELVLGVRLLHHALKTNQQTELFQKFLVQLDAFKQELRKLSGCTGDC